MSESDLDSLIIALLLNHDQKLGTGRITDVLYPIVQRHERFLTKERLRQRIIRRLYRFLDVGLIEQEGISHKNRPYSIKDKARAQIILTMRPIDQELIKELTKKPQSFEASVSLSGKTYKDAIGKLSEALLKNILQRKEILAHFQTESPRPIISDICIPVPSEKGSVTAERILIVVPDDASKVKIAPFTQEQYRSFLQYLTAAWEVYFEGRTRSHDDIAIVPFSKQVGDELREIVISEGYKNIGDPVSLATLTYLDIRRKEKGYFLIQTGSMMKMAVEKGDYKDLKDAVSDAVRLLEKRLAHKYDKSY